MTENGAITLINLDDAMSGPSIRGLPAAGRRDPRRRCQWPTAAIGVEGRLLARACSNFGGYLRRPHLNNTDADGWFDTGDLAEIDDRGYVRITVAQGRHHPRRREHPVVEIESLLYKHPAIGQVAIVAYPDERLGERGCAVVVPKPGQGIDLPTMIDFLKSQKIALQYIPNAGGSRRDAATPSGKIQKFKLREIVRQSSE